MLLTHSLQCVAAMPFWNNVFLLIHKLLYNYLIAKQKNAAKLKCTIEEFCSTNLHLQSYCRLSQVQYRTSGDKTSKFSQATCSSEQWKHWRKIVRTTCFQSGTGSCGPQLFCAPAPHLNCWVHEAGVTKVPEATQTRASRAPVTVVVRCAAVRWWIVQPAQCNVDT